MSEHFWLGVHSHHHNGFGKLQQVIGFRKRARRLAARVPRHEDTLANARALPARRGDQGRAAGVKQHAFDNLLTQLNARAFARPCHHRDIGVARVHRSDTTEVARQRFRRTHFCFLGRTAKTRLYLLAFNFSLLARAAQ